MNIYNYDCNIMYKPLLNMIKYDTKEDMINSFNQCLNLKKKELVNNINDSYATYPYCYHTYGFPIKNIIKKDVNNTNIDNVFMDMSINTIKCWNMFPYEDNSVMIYSKTKN